ncbi:MAG: hypothetical protein QF685_04830 [Verrucomicrobiota bacterium]|jgi:hypothetical protein|nr:hypothetical protein [Verrucomicrobiota bacterium]
MKYWVPLFLVIAALGCGGGHDHNHNGGNGHGHKAPHGGVLVNVGDEFCHLEFVREPESNRLQLHVMRFHPKEGLLKIPMEQIEISAKVGDEEKVIILKPVELDGITATDQPTSLYVAEVDWLKNAANFDGTVKELKIEGKIFSEIAFQFTKPD